MERDLLLNKVSWTTLWSSLSIPKPLLKPTLKPKCPWTPQAGLRCDQYVIRSTSSGPGYSSLPHRSGLGTHQAALRNMGSVRWWYPKGWLLWGRVCFGTVSLGLPDLPVLQQLVQTKLSSTWVASHKGLFIFSKSTAALPKCSWTAAKKKKKEVNGKWVPNCKSHWNSIQSPSPCMKALVLGWKVTFHLQVNQQAA